MQNRIANSVAIILALGIGVTTAAFAGHVEAGDRLEMAAVLKAPITPTQAVRIAENSGGRALSYGMEANQHGHWYEVSVLRGDAKLLLRIDATTGKVLGSAPAHGDDAQGARALQDSKLSFAAAIAQAERLGNGPALEANAGGHAKSAHVDVDIIKDHGQRVAHYRVTLHRGRIDATPIGTDS